MIDTRPTRQELAQEAYLEKVDELRCFFHAEMVFEESYEGGDLYVCPAKGCRETAVIS